MNKNDYSKNKSNKIFIHHKLIKDREPENILVKNLTKKSIYSSKLQKFSSYWK